MEPLCQRLGGSAEVMDVLIVNGCLLLTALTASYGGYCFGRYAERHRARESDRYDD